MPRFTAIRLETGIHKGSYVVKHTGNRKPADTYGEQPFDKQYACGGCWKRFLEYELTSILTQIAPAGEARGRAAITRAEFRRQGCIEKGV